MATLLKLDSKFINLDTVFEINDYGDRIRVYYAVPSCDPVGTQQPSYAEVDGLAAELLRRWLSHHCIDLLEQLSAEERAAVEQRYHREHGSAQAAQAVAEQAREPHTNSAAPEAADGRAYGATRPRRARRAAPPPPEEREVSG